MNARQRNTARTTDVEWLGRIRRRLDDSDTRLGTILVLLLGLIPLIGLFYVGYIMWETPSVEGLRGENFEQSTIVYTSGGKEITRYYEKNRRWITLDSMATVLPKALVATEDRRFYEHQGIDVRRTGGAILQTLMGNLQGGSTITMQLARNLYPDVGDDWAITRKIKEWFTALRLEDQYSKNQILELYLNTVPFGYNAYGVEAASQTYFSRTAFQLDTLQSAQLVGMLRGTSLYDPVDHAERARKRRNVVIEQLKEADYITEAAAQRLKEQETPLDFAPITHTNNFAPYFAERVRRRLSDWAEEHGQNLYTGGLRVYTTLNAKMQQAADEAVHEELNLLQNVVDVEWSQSDSPYFSGNAEAYQPYVQRIDPFAYYWQANPEALNAFVKRSETFKQRVKQGQSEEEALAQLKQNTAFVDSLKEAETRLQAGLVALDPTNGYVKAWVGGRNFERSPYDHVALAKRQPGSTFKPFVYSAALDEGYRPNDLFRDEKITYTAPQTGRTWSPGNFGEETGRMIPLRQALAQSKNTVTSQLAVELGPSRIAQQAREMGIESELNEVPSLALGTSPVTLLNMAAAYSVLANQGQYHKPTYIRRIESADGRVIERFAPEEQRAISASTAYGTLDMMRGVVSEGGTGIRIRAQYGARGDLAGKTGTTQNNADGWFMLLHPNLVTGAWVGFDSPAITFRTRYWGQGSHNALRIVGHFFQDANLPTDARFEEPASYIEPIGPDSVGTFRAYTGSGLERRDRVEDTLGRDRIADTLGGDIDVDTDAEVDTTLADDVADEQQTEPEEESSEPQSAADSLTQQARDNNNVQELLERKREMESGQN